MTRKKLTAIITSYALAACIVAGGLIYRNYQETLSYRRHIDNTYQHAFSELTSAVGEMDSALQKSIYATSPSMISTVCTEIYGKAQAAEMAMSELPFSDYRLEQTASFIAKAGDYAFSLSRKAASGISDDERKNLESMSNAASVLSGNLTQLLADINDGKIRASELSSAVKSAGDSDGAAALPLGDSFSLIENEFPEIPVLVYDGPFSQHIADAEPKLLKGLAEVSEKEAQAIASEFLDLNHGAFDSVGVSEGKLPTYTFRTSADSSETTVEVTRTGGQVIEMHNSRAPASARISPEVGLKIAEKFLKKHGYDSMKDSYWQVNDNIAVYNFAYSQDGVICYQDLVKVSVALDNGNILGFECHGYTVNHYTRNIPEAKVSEEEAMKSVPDSLQVVSHNMAIIPTVGLYERYCHEFVCQNDHEQHYIIYVDAVSGEQANILILLESDSGALTV